MLAKRSLVFCICICIFVFCISILCALYWSPEPAGLWLILVVPPHNGDVEVNPKEDVDDEEGDERLREIRDIAPTSFQLQPDIGTQHQADTLKVAELIRMMQHK